MLISESIAEGIQALKLESDAGVIQNKVKELLEKGDVLHDIFVQDNLHLNAKGYGIWSRAIRSALIPGESGFEK